MKRPEYGEFKKKYDEAKGDKNVMSDMFGVTLQTIYNWISYFQTGFETDDMYKDDDSEPELKNFSYYVGKQRDSLNIKDKREIDIDLREDSLIVCLSDTHFGSIYSDSDRALSDAKIIKDTPNVFGVFVGDLIDYQGSGPKGIEFDQAFSHPSVSRAMGEAYVKELSDKLLFLTTGCHSNWTYRWTGETFEERLRNQLTSKAVYKDAVQMNIRVGDETEYLGFATHKLRSHSAFNPGHGLFRLAREQLPIDIGIAAHRHTPGIAAQMIQGRPVTVINCGTYKLVDNFANKLGIVQQPISIPGFVIKAKTKSIIPFIDWRKGLDLV